MSPLSCLDKEKCFTIVFFDIETYTDESKRLIPNMLCSAEYKISENKTEHVLVSKNTFRGEKCIEEFIQKYFPLNPSNDSYKNVCYISHNGSRFDNYFIFNKMLTLRPSYRPNTVVKGTQYMRIEYPNRRFFLDSILLIPTPLKDFTKTFNLSESKGAFPHKFNKPENFEYSGKFPSIDFFDIDSFKSEKELKEFKTWFDSVKDNNFVLWDELEKYCASDVELLALGCLKFHDFILDEFRVQLFSPNYSKIFTIASLSMEIFRYKFYTKEILMNVPHQRRSKNHSKISISYFNTFNPDYIHAGNYNGEVRIGPFHVDAYNPSKKSIILFHGCFFHGHHCINKDRHIPLSTFANKTISNASTEKTYAFSTLEDRYSMSELTKNLLLNWGYSVSVVWECDAKRKIKYESKPALLLNPGEMVRGGRTEVFKIHSKIMENPDETEGIKYLDITSLYPYILCTKDFPIGDVKIVSRDISKEEWESVSDSVGIANVTVILPEDLMIPVLPFCFGNGKKVLYPLCGSCAHGVASG